MDYIQPQDVPKQHTNAKMINVKSVNYRLASFGSRLHVLQILLMVHVVQILRIVHVLRHTADLTQLVIVYRQ